MRTTIDIDDDVLAVAKELAKAEGKSMGTVISELARRALTAPSQQGYPGFAEAPAMFGADWPTFPDRDGVVVTTEMIERIQDEIDREDAIPFDFTTGKPRTDDDRAG